MIPVVDEPLVRTGGPNGGGPRDSGPGDDGRGEPEREGSVPGLALLGMRLTLLSVTIFFVAAGVAYFARSRTGLNWQRIPAPTMLWVSTALILASSWTLEAARGARALRWLSATVLLGTAFLASQLFALRQLIEQGAYLARNPHSSMLFLITGAHGLHLLGGMAALYWLILKRRWTRFPVTALYWHFLDALWLALFLCLLLWP
jgi:cytochrome c oxidase subunit 3